MVLDVNPVHRVELDHRIEKSDYRHKSEEKFIFHVVLFLDGSFLQL